ncbi:MAG TPA: sugar ABC transporter substrate-binding protein [Christensenellaceae bacterium]|jgi:multiple sugar transport system substrate-binding protein|nr:sugar ABC transporter substrate-binding protein [Christensenellaceae bacterium]
MNMKRLLNVLLALVMVVSIIPIATNAEGTTLTYWFWADNDKYAATMREMIADFNATNSKGTVIVGEQIPWDGGSYSNTLLQAAIGGGGPDVATFKLTATPSFVNNGLLENLDPFIEKWDKKDEINENMYNVMRGASGTDSVYVMPWNVQVLYVYYRPSMYKEAGIEVPKTYEEFLEACEKLTRDTDGDGVTDVYGFGMRGSNGGQEPWGCFIYANGGTFETLDSEESIKGMQDYIDLFTNGYAPPTAPNDGFSQVIDGFQSGITAMTIHHTGSSAQMIEQFGEDVDAFIFPAGKGQWTSMGDTENVMFSSCEDKEAAFEWLAYLAAGKGQETWCSVTGNVPVASSVQGLERFQNDRFMKVSIEGQSVAGILPIRETTTSWISEWPSIIQQALLGETTAKECMEELQALLWE